MCVMRKKNKARRYEEFKNLKTGKITNRKIKEEDVIISDYPDYSFEELEELEELEVFDDENFSLVEDEEEYYKVIKILPCPYQLDDPKSYKKQIKPLKKAFLSYQVDVEISLALSPDAQHTMHSISTK
jgi:hypothetical protein